ncbi:MAG: hypothetical protein PHO14_05130 [Kiritimatiellae bacterium]|nr:hypothetical protein [Kiritimatiellia bacterium]MDD4341599.1 hypothetical protein [Kiritimatiellia bacterium]MDY0149314.1 hypothetical protein [Kiritimatiellia bacterium]
MNTLTVSLLLLFTGAPTAGPPPAAQPVPPASPPVSVPARVSGTLKEWRVSPGMTVQAGRWVATLATHPPAPDPLPLRRKLQTSESDLVDVRRAYLEARQQVKIGETPSAPLPQLLQAFQHAQARRNTALSRLEAAQHATEQLRHYAPCAGTVRDAGVVPGSRVAAGAPLLFIQP